MIRNYFADLELGIDASDEDVRRAYRRLSRRYHPDLNPDDTLAEESFRRITEAFEFLSSSLRADTLREKLEKHAKSVNKPYQKWDLVPVIPQSPDQFVNEWFEENTSVLRRKLKSNRNAELLDVRLEVFLESETYHKGGRQILQYEYDRVCQSCRGSGGQSESVRVSCKRCGGLGHHLINRGANHWRKTCEICVGRGYEVLGACKLCKGRGKVPDIQLVELKIESRERRKTDQIILKGLGNMAFDSKRRGDVWLQLVQRK